MNKKVISGVTGIFVAMLLGALIMLFQNYDPLETYGALFSYSLGDFYSLATTLQNSVPLILTGLSASLAFASGPVNLGQPGQFLMGALLVTIGGLYVDLPPVLMIPFLILLAMLGGALWSGVAALLRQWFGMSEFITTLMLNMIADFFTYWAITYPFYDQSAFSPMTPLINRSGWLPEFGEFNSSVIVMLLAFAGVWFIFTRFTAGYEWRITGQNSLFARLGGCDINKNYLTVMLVTGALAGLAGGLVIMAGPHRFLKGIGANYAWDGVMIAMVANNGLIATVLYGLFFATLQTGALGMELITAVPSEFIQVLQAAIVLIIVAGREYLDIFMDRTAARRKAKERSA
ncbi:ABC transporter permease [Ornatilinea apprima]|uniref:ABC transporter permease n=1 Tax=Ornatilinea apprima TaxID=1134406 RepID=A0A0P6Y0H1_9CHLR|nr:ABC transporter permease [Ornatilinea apprima]KPL78813.1 ABC transporter permease [Ornatilinea apprima]